MNASHVTPVCDRQTNICMRRAVKKTTYLTVSSFHMQDNIDLSGVNWGLTCRKAKYVEGENGQCLPPLLWADSGVEWGEGVIYCTFRAVNQKAADGWLIECTSLLATAMIVQTKMSMFCLTGIASGDFKCSFIPWIYPLQVWICRRGWRQQQHTVGARDYFVLPSL